MERHEPGLPMGATRERGAPVGVHLIGPPFEEETIFTAAKVIEVRNGLRTPIEPLTKKRSSPCLASCG
jgi:Asp-tRNA(Asn)/Glu-tRNA(Gln) amidotransferase A subunit family amidase